MPAAMGCSERLSSEAARRRTSSPGRASSGTTSTTANRPSVRVPVLSNTTASRSRARSNARRSRTNACGQVMTITVTTRSSAKAKSRPAASQTASVTLPAANAMSVSQSAARLARSCVRERVSCARRTIPQAQGALNHRRERQHGHRERERDPEPPPKVGDHVRVVVVMFAGHSARLCRLCRSSPSVRRCLPPRAAARERTARPDSGTAHCRALREAPAHCADPESSIPPIG